MEQTLALLLAAVKSEIEKTPLGDDAVKALSDSETARKLYELADFHDLAHFVGAALSRNGVTIAEPAAGKFKKKLFESAYRFELISGEFKNVSKVLENAGIEFIPLKGSVLRDFYPEPWMRTSCDSDILVREQELEKAVSVLVSEGGCAVIGKTAHDVSLTTPGKAHIELHYSLIEDGRAVNAYKVLESVWEHTKVKQGFSFWHEMSDDMFYFYHIAHMFKHFEAGGCGIRTFVDLWILDSMPSADKAARDNLLAKGSLTVFAGACRKLCGVWFNADKPDSISEKMQSYILSGGVYGVRDNYVSVNQIKRGGKIKYALSRIFLPYNVLKYIYPVIQKHKWLTPVFEVVRWFSLVFGGKLRKSVRELAFNSKIASDKADETRAFLKEIGIIE